MERHPELIRKAGAAAAIDSAATLWLECITLPSIAISVVKRAALASGVGASVGVSLAALPLILPACAFGADGLMQWAFRPAIAYWREPSETLLLGEGADYVPAPTDEMLAAIGARGGGGDALLLQGLLPPDMDPLERAQLEWALDGDASSTFPDASDALEVLSAQRAKKRAAAGAVPTGGAFSGSGGEVGAASGADTRGDAVYMLATARLIRERAAARAAAAAAKEGGGVAGLTGGEAPAAASRQSLQKTYDTLVSY